MKLKVLFHDNCFDGAASAAIFAHWYRGRNPGAEVTWQGVQHKAGDPFGPDAFDGDENVCVDFRYSANPKLTWWFDHHVSAFQEPGDRAHFEADTSGRKFYDPAAKSCTKFEARVLADRFGWDSAPFGDLIDWAELIDGALFPDARTAVELASPALRIMTWIENNKDKAATFRYIEDLSRGRSLAEIAADPYVAGPLAPLLDKHHGHIEAIRSRAILDGHVVHFDLSDTGIEAHNKFIAYMLFPSARYTVGITRSPQRMKISVGSNPWPAAGVPPRTHNIAKICERYGGGGHPVVGAISLPAAELDRARQIANEIVAELQQE